MKLFVEPVIGYRAWILNAGTYGLRSPVCTRGEDWNDDGPTVARCAPTITDIKGVSPNHLQTEHTSPHRGCWCGIHGWHRPRETENYLDGGDFAVVGAALAWGRYRVATKGFRIQFMRPLVLVDQNPDRDVLGWKSLLREVAERYGVELVPREELQEYAEQYAKPMGISFME